MSEVIDIYGTKIKLPEPPPPEEILYYNLPREKQKWVKEDLPSYFDVVEVDKNGDLILTAQQELYAQEQIKRCKRGVWAMIGGKLRYIPGRYYFFLQNYILEDGNAPDFREADRLYFLFFGYWFLIEWCLGIARGKKRREGASSQATSNLIYECIFYKNTNAGLVSKAQMILS